MRKRNPTPSLLELEYLFGSDPAWNRLRSRCYSKVCLNDACGHVMASDATECPRCGEWELAKLERFDAASRALLEEAAKRMQQQTSPACGFATDVEDPTP